MMLPYDLRAYVCSHQYGDILDEVPFFADGGAVFRAEIATCFTERLVLTGCRVYEMGEVGLEMFVLREGTVDVLDPSIPAGASVLGRGAYFGELTVPSVHVHHVSWRSVHSFVFSFRLGTIRLPVSLLSPSVCSGKYWAEHVSDPTSHRALNQAMRIGLSDQAGKLATKRVCSCLL